MALKGKTTIELTDVNTGEVTVVEDNNFVTNAFHDICQPILRDHDTMHRTMSYYNQRISVEHWTGGLLMFDTALEDNPDNYFPPVTANIVGHGSEVTYSGADLTLGSFNNNLSDISSPNKRVYVWDFTAEQANGNIASVCLTTRVGGMVGYGTEIAGEANTSYQRLFANFTKSTFRNYYPSSRRNTRPIYLSFENDYVLFIDYNNISIGSVTFMRTYIASKTEDIFGQTNENSDYGKKWTQIGSSYTKYEFITLDLTSIIGSSGYTGMAQDGKYLYIARNSVLSYYWTANSKITVVKIDLETLTYESFEVINTTGEQLTAFAYNSVDLVNGYTFGICDGYMFVTTTGTGYGANLAKVYAINLEDNTVVRQVKTADGNENIAFGTVNSYQYPFGITLQGKVTFISHKTHFFSSNILTPIKCVCTTDFIAKSMGTTNWMCGASSAGYATNYNYYIFPTDNMLYFGRAMLFNMYQDSSNVEFFLNIYPNVLMTINNLATPVTKTPSQTMRITYTLTKEE